MHARLIMTATSRQFRTAVARICYIDIAVPTKFRRMSAKYAECAIHCAERTLNDLECARFRRELTRRAAAGQLCLGALSGTKSCSAADHRPIVSPYRDRDLDITGDAFHPEWNETIRPPRLGES